MEPLTVKLHRIVRKGGFDADGGEIGQIVLDEETATKIDTAFCTLLAADRSLPYATHIGFSACIKGSSFAGRHLFYVNVDVYSDGVSFHGTESFPGRLKWLPRRNLRVEGSISPYVVRKALLGQVAA